MKKRFAALLALVAVAAAPNVHSTASAATVPDTLNPPTGATVSFKAVAAGVQIYTCTEQTATPGAFAWTLKAPDAGLWDSAGARLGTHYAGPTWQGADGSLIVGEVLARADAPTAGAIPWLLLRVTSRDGAGILSPITYVQRLDTAGGVAPADGCSGAEAGAERAVPYTAVYAFFSEAVS